MGFSSLFLWLRDPPLLSLFPYTTLFRSRPRRRVSATQALLWYRCVAAGPLFAIILTRLFLTLGLHTRGDRCAQLVVDRKSTRLNSSHVKISYAVFCLKKKKKNKYCCFNK